MGASPTRLAGSKEQGKVTIELQDSKHCNIIYRGGRYNRYIGILQFCKKTIRTAIRFSQHRYIGNFRKSPFISVDSLRKGSCHVFVAYLSWNRRYINLLIKTGRAVVNNNTSISYGVCVVMHFLHGKRCVTDATASSVIQDGG